MPLDAIVNINASTVTIAYRSSSIVFPFSSWHGQEDANDPTTKTIRKIKPFCIVPIGSYSSRHAQESFFFLSLSFFINTFWDFQFIGNKEGNLLIFIECQGTVQDAVVKSRLVDLRRRDG